ncbi:MAG: hypothetical protein BWY09_01194 [Candidatus Hydrogenedentes bacterium ADurb.Bin179]|nr:MAG: hypothetical protein BWY09_01194 [Candidatus Hydrogenedentes bacterium ADurb.Bin179]
MWGIMALGGQGCPHHNRVACFVVVQAYCLPKE